MTELAEEAVSQIRSLSAALSAPRDARDRALAERLVQDCLASTHSVVRLWVRLQAEGEEGLWLPDLRKRGAEILDVCRLFQDMHRQASVAMLVAFGPSPPSEPGDVLRRAAEVKEGPYDPGETLMRLSRAGKLVQEVERQTHRLLEWASRPSKGPTGADAPAGRRD